MLKAENLNQALADISVIIPAYNRAGLIGETLHSLLNQTVSAKEIIVVDDGSTDGTAEAVLRYAAENGCLMAEDGGAAAAQPMAESEFRRTNSQNPNRHSLNNPLSAIRNPPSITAKPRLRVIRQANAGPGAARNRGLAEATGEFIHFFDSDDIAAPNKHEVQLRALLETGADIAYGPWGKGRFLPLEKLKHGKAETLKTELTTIERQGGRENRKLGKAEGRATESWPQRGAASGSMQVNEQPKVGPKGEGVGTTESNDTDIHNRESWQIRGRATEGWPEGRIETLGKVENRKPGRAEGRATGGWPEGRGIGGDASQRLPRGSSEGGAGWENLRIK